MATAAAGTGFLLLAALGYALAHPDHSTAALLRLSWCAIPVAATVHLAVAVARTDPAARPRSGLSAFGLGPARLMAIAALNTALACVLGSLLALLVFLHLRGDLTGMPFDGAAKDFLAPDRPLPLPAALTLLTVLPVLASTTVAMALRPRDLPHPGTRSRRYGRFGAYETTARRESFGTYGRFGANFFRAPTTAPRPPDNATPTLQPSHTPTTGSQLPHTPTTDTDSPHAPTTDAQSPHVPTTGTQPPLATGGQPPSAPTTGSRSPLRPLGGAQPARHPAGGRAAVAARVGADGTLQAPGSDTPPTPAPTDGTLSAPVSETHPPAPADRTEDTPDQLPGLPGLPAATPLAAATLAGLPWGVAVLAAGLAVESYAGFTGTTPQTALPGGLAVGPVGVLVGWSLTALGLVLAAPGLTHVCGLLLQSVRPGARRLLAGRVLMAEATRIGRPLGVVCAVASAAFAATTLDGDDGSAPAFGPLTVLGGLLVAGCTVATLLTTAVAARQSRADTTSALLRLGAPTTVLRSAAALRAGALVAFFGPLTLLVAELAALPLAR
ncbi:hypothetical protein GCM10011578_039040 [Streptomyces fuscichromogenes]|uniref:Integral membrane protein n=1 Tax=Streptomyces fuscichromogenes TaxID=1324013 RepID=A0A917XDP8_9ACTN|nr:hypothetical protein GCM10011578_039040 [Streptomyces fuscichromogenes]